MIERTAILKLDGAVEKPIALTFDDLDILCPTCKVDDLRKIVQGWTGEAVWLKAVLKQAKPTAEATHATFHSSDGFAASVPVDQITDGVIIYKKDDLPLSEKMGGPLRLFLPKGPSFCSNIKRLSRVEMTVGKGKDTTPAVSH